MKILKIFKKPVINLLYLVRDFTIMTIIYYIYILILFRH